MVEGLGVLSYSERLRVLDLYSVKGRLLRADMLFIWRMFNGECPLSPNVLFLLDNSITRGHSKKLFMPRCNLDLRRRSLAIRVIRTWNLLSANTVEAPSLNLFKKNLHNDLGHKLYDYDE